MLINNLIKYRIILASKSPRRQQLLTEMGVKFDVATRDYEEVYPPDLTGKDIAEFLAYAKASTFKNELKENEIVITADTIVWCNDEVLGKPSGRDEAILMLQKLSGNTHKVITGVTILSSGNEKTFSESTKVTFHVLDIDEIKYYIDNYKPFDKAGSYGIQEWIGIAACSRIEGSYFNVVGLPAQRLYKELKEFVE